MVQRAKPAEPYLELRELFGLRPLAACRNKLYTMAILNRQGA
jgi:hypothetical protein